ncbi:J domain-containing protein [Oceanobacillus jeddahense]|uniref:J domain-containing protein n=1 Tax=Oceanobacillus jeddahense TaxID=1462527 RepID=UPI0006948759|nr:DnaJ domain-containing protein [Oceanobacillus jeddahense]
MNKVKNESYYKILGTTANIGQARIEEKYLEALEKHPLETDPEGHTKVQEAYEVLKDPEKRAAYDETRKNGKKSSGHNTKKTDTVGSTKAEKDNISGTETNEIKQPDEAEQLIIDAKNAMDNGDNQTAFEIYKKLNKLVPDSGEIKFKLLKLASLNNDVNEMEKVFSEIIPLTISDEEQQVIYALKADIYQDHGYLDKAIETYEYILKKFPEQATMFGPALAHLYAHTKQPDKALHLMEQSQPTENEDIKTTTAFYLNWIDTIIILENWPALSKVLSKFKKHLKKITDEDTLTNLKDELMEQYMYFHKGALFQEAEIYIGLADTVTNKNDNDIKQAYNETKKQARLQKEINKLSREINIHQLIYYKAYEWFYTGKVAAARVIAVINELPTYIRQQLEDDKESYAAGILQLKKKYPFIYKTYQNQWDSLFEQLTVGLSREERRNLRKKK